MDGVLELLVDKLLSGAEHSLIAMRRKGMALNPAYVQLNEASVALRKEIERRKQNTPHKRHVVRFLMDKEFRISVDGEAALGWWRKAIRTTYTTIARTATSFVALTLARQV